MEDLSVMNTTNLIKAGAASAVLAAGVALSGAAIAAPTFTIAPSCLSAVSPGPGACTAANGGIVPNAGFGAMLPGVANFTADTVGHTFRSTLDTTPTGIGTGTFTDNGTMAITSFVANGTPRTVVETFLGLGYNLYATFQATGNYVVIPPSGPDPLTVLGTFTSFVINLFVDPDLNTTFGDFDHTPTGDTTNDRIIATGTLLSGDAALLFGTQTTGSFSARVQFNPVTSPAANPAGTEVNHNGFFNAPNPFYATFQVAGQPQVITLTDGDPVNGDFDLTAQLSGGGTGFFEVPEPATMTLFGVGLIGLAAASRRRRIAA